MSGFDDPYRHPRDDRRGRDYDYRDERGRGGRGGYGGGRGDFGDGRRAYEDRDYEGGSSGRNRGWDDHNERDWERGRYEERDYPRGPPYERDTYSPARHEHRSGYATPPTQGFQSYGPPDHNYQHQSQEHHQPYAGYPTVPGSQVDASAAPPLRSKGPVQPEAVSASVIFLGLPPHAVDIHLRQFLENMGASIDSTTVIMDRATGVSKQFGFAKFSSVEHARAFVEPNFPSIPWREPSGPAQYDGMRVKINYSQKSGGWREDQGANARLTDDQRKTEGTSQSFYVNDGTRDIGSTPSNTLLLRGLDPLTAEEEIYSTLLRVGGRASQEIAQGGIKRVMVAKDRASRSSWGFAFVQFADVRLATDVLGAVFNPQFHPAGFRVRSAIVAASFAHENSFIPVYAASTWSFRGDGGTQLAYWDDKGFVSPWTPPPPPDPKEAMKGVPRGPRAHEDAKAEADLAAFFDDLEAGLPLDSNEDGVEDEGSVDQSAEALGAKAASASAAASDSKHSATLASAAPAPAPKQSAPVSHHVNAPVPGSIAPITIKPVAGTSVATSASIVAGPQPPPDLPDARAKPPVAVIAAAPLPTAALGGKEKKSDLIISRKAAPNIAKWNVKAKEIRTPASGTAAKATAKSSSASTTAGASVAPVHPPSGDGGLAAPALAAATASPPGLTANPGPAADDEFAHGDPVTFVCLLCQRQFKGVEELRKHNKLSALHKTNLANPDAVAASSARKVASLKKQTAASSTTDAPHSTSGKPKYVDRAAARRDVHGAIEEGSLGGSSNKKRKFEGPEPPAPPPSAPNKDGLEESNAGRKMLEKMGWTAGAGLGATGDGRVAPVQAAQFQQGAGLGSTKGIAVGSEEPKNHAERLRLKALERFEGS